MASIISAGELGVWAGIGESGLLPVLSAGLAPGLFRILMGRYNASQLMVDFVIVLSQIDTVVLILVAIMVGLAFLVAAVAFIQWRSST